jgi:hypothetical protein
VPDLTDRCPGGRPPTRQARDPNPPPRPLPLRRQQADRLPSPETDRQHAKAPADRKPALEAPGHTIASPARRHAVHESCRRADATRFLHHRLQRFVLAHTAPNPPAGNPVLAPHTLDAPPHHRTRWTRHRFTARTGRATASPHALGAPPLHARAGRATASRSRWGRHRFTLALGAPPHHRTRWAHHRITLAMRAPPHQPSERRVPGTFHVEPGLGRPSCHQRDVVAASSRCIKAGCNRPDVVAGPESCAIRHASLHWRGRRRVIGPTGRAMGFGPTCARSVKRGPSPAGPQTRKAHAQSGHPFDVSQLELHQLCERRAQARSSTVSRGTSLQRNPCRLPPVATRPSLPASPGERPAPCGTSLQRNPCRLPPVATRPSLPASPGERPAP